VSVPVNATLTAARPNLERIFAAALAAVAPERLVRSALAGEVAGGEGVPAIIADARAIHLIAAGKAALGMAAEIERTLGAKLRTGVAVVPRGAPTASAPAEGRASPPRGTGFQPVSCGLPSTVEIIESSHPVPDDSSVRAAAAVLRIAKQGGEGDLVVAALSGGASSMLAMPAGSISLQDKVAVTSALLRAGATIRELNIVRKHLSAIKGGRLLRALPERARMLALIISDVMGNDLSTIASGPTTADPSTYAEAISVLKRFSGVWGRTPEPVREHLELGAAGRIDETVKPGDPILDRVTNLIIGDNRTALDATEAEARALGYEVDRWRELRGEADDVGHALAAHLCAIRNERLCVLAGGEPVVTVRGAGRGGRAQQCALALAIELSRIGRDCRIAALFAGTDGIDGPTDAAGAFAAPDTVQRAEALGLNPEQALRRSDSYNIFNPLGDLMMTGSTGTNVADLFIGLVNW
jgi:glycerate 2-kinase